MKTKKSLNKKLFLNMKTVADLDRAEMNHLLGAWGGPTEVTNCMTNCVSGCPTCDFVTKVQTC